MGRKPSVHSGNRLSPRWNLNLQPSMEYIPSRALQCHKETPLSTLLPWHPLSSEHSTPHTNMYIAEQCYSQVLMYVSPLKKNWKLGQQIKMSHVGV